MSSSKVMDYLGPDNGWLGNSTRFAGQCHWDSFNGAEYLLSMLNDRQDYKHTQILKTCRTHFNMAQL